MTLWHSLYIDSSALAQKLLGSSYLIEIRAVGTVSSTPLNYLASNHYVGLKGMQAFKPWCHLEGSSAPDFKS